MPVTTEQGRIHSLPSVLASQIAAGEVIERPASVVKELLENSLDAGASRIQVDVEAAGSRLIRVRDDGRGIHPDDLALAIAPHSTSKIHSAEDLAAIYSLGFRGEALASIAAVARLKITSRHADLPAVELITEPGSAPLLPAPAAHPAGTTLEVRDLFFNVPARRKFLRSEQTEFLQIMELVKAFALARTQLGLKLTHNGRQVFSIGRASSQHERILQIFGRSFLEQACMVEETADGLSLHGVAGQAAAARSQADRQYLFLNGRLVRDRRLNHALRSAYADMLPAGRYAPFLLYLDMDAADYDINVHPTKHEVRFRASRDVHDFLYSALRRSLEAGLSPDGWQQAPPATADVPRQQPAMAIRETGGPAYVGASSRTPVPGTYPEHGFGRLLGCVLGRYLLTEAASALTVIDAQAVQEQLTRLELEQAWQQGGLDARPLLLPATRTAGAGEIRRVEAAQDSLAGLGLRLDVSSPSQLALRALPVALPAVDADALLEALVGQLSATGSQAPAGELRPTVFSLLARHAGAAFDPAADRQVAERLLQRLAAAQADNLLAEPRPWKTLDAAGLAAWLGEHD